MIARRRSSCLPGIRSAPWRPAETRAGELGQLLSVLDATGAYALVSEGLDADTLASRLEGAGLPAPVQLSREGGEDDSRWLESVRAANPELERLLLLRPAGEQSEGRQAFIFGGCDSLRARLGRAQEEGLTRLESFLDRVDELLAATWSEALSDRRETLDAMRGKASKNQSCSAAAREHAAELLSCAASSGACQWSPRVFLQDFARVGRVSEPPELGLDDDGCGEDLRDIMREADAASIEVLTRTAPRWSELAARVATLGTIDAAVEDTCAPRRRRISDDSLASLRGQMAAIEAQLARGASYPSTGPSWIESVPEGARWVGADASFHVPGHGAVRELARFEAGARAASTQVRERAQALGAAISGAGECMGRAGEAPLAWTVYELPSLEVIGEGEVFPETLVCGDLPLAL